MTSKEGKALSCLRLLRGWADDRKEGSRLGGICERVWLLGAALMTGRKEIDLVVVVCNLLVVVRVC